MKTGTGILKRIALAVSLACVVVSSAQARTVAQKKQAARAQFEQAERLRDSLLGTPESDRERRDYQKVMDAYRKVYYTAPSWGKADAAVLAVAELLDDQGRVFNDPKSYKDAIGQLAFLRREYPGSKRRVEALFTIAQIYRDDLNDEEQAMATFQDFLKHYPNSTLAPKARQALAEIGNAEIGGSPFKAKARKAKRAPRNRAEHEAKAAWADVAPLKRSSDKPRNKTEAKSSRTPANAAPAEDKTPAADAPAETPTQAQQDISATLPKVSPQPGNRLPRLTSIRHWSTPDYVRVAIDLEQEVQYQSGRVPRPDRIFFDLYGVKLAPDLVGKSFDVEAGFLHKIRVAQYKLNMARVVLDVDDVAEYSAFLLPNPYRLIIDIHGKMPARQMAGKKRSKPGAEDVVPEIKPDVQEAKQTPAEAKPAQATTKDADTGSSDVTMTSVKPAGSMPSADSATALRKAEAAKGGPMKGASKPSAGAEVAKADPPKIVVDDNDSSIDAHETDKATTTKPTSGPTYEAVAPQQSSRNRKNRAASDTDAARGNNPVTTTHVAAPAANGERSLIRALGLKIGKIVVDAGHGGHDTGTIGPNGLQEKDLVLDVALKLGKLLENKLGAEVVYTRDDDTFIPLETRTAIANKEQADLFISIHANSSSDQAARGIETYYLNFTSSRDALEVAARENAVSEKSIHELQDLVKKIALKEKIEESHEFAADVQKSLYAGLNARNPGLRNRGVKKAPFIVLIGANMPSILAEISFVSNPQDEKKLKTSDYRQRIAESLYKGVSTYISGLSGVKVASKVERHEASAASAAGLK
jgi:N-acetylmuramoyl-L-alanine amidase